MSEEKKVIWIWWWTKKMSRYLGRRWFDVHVTIPAEQVFSAKHLQQISLINRNEESLSFPEEWCHLTSLTACTSFGAKTIFRAQLATTCKRNLIARKSSKLVIKDRKSKNVWAHQDLPEVTFQASRSSKPDLNMYDLRRKKLSKNVFFVSFVSSQKYLST